MGRLVTHVLGLLLICGCGGMRFVWERPRVSEQKLVCLTFDDGPNGEATERVLAVLRQHQIQATFFLVGKNVERYPELAQRIVREGHLVGNHSYGHDDLLAFHSMPHIRRDLERTNRIIQEVTGSRPRYFRPPIGLMTKRLEQVCHELDLRPVGVHVFVFDSWTTNPRRIARRVLRKVGDGPQVLVLHDGFGLFKWRSRTAVAGALELIIPELNRRGYNWVGLEQF